jgi:hypothetical protein
MKIEGFHRPLLIIMLIHLVLFIEPTQCSDSSSDSLFYTRMEF